MLDAGGLKLSALLAEPPGPPRSTVVALHGGGMNAGYFDGQAHSTLSLLTLGAALGHTVLAVDRPGYGISAPDLPEGQNLAEQSAALRLALEDFASGHSLGAGLFVLAHSYGGKLALTAAADGLHDELIGLDVSGCGHRYAAPPETLAPGAGAHGKNGGNGGKGGNGGNHRLNWGPLSLYPPETFTLAAAVVSGMPVREGADAVRWEESFPAVAARVRVPLRLTFAEHEAWWRHDEDAVAELGELLPVPRLLVDRQPSAGHNISLGWAARSYHLRAFGFLEECLQSRAATGALV